jgi:OOP family OmpA-OmpF porin
MGKLKPGAKLIIFAILVGTLYFGVTKAMYYGWIPRPNALKSMVPAKTDIIEAEVLEHNTNVKPVALPSKTATTQGGTPIRFLLWAWNSQLGAMFANGGPVTTQGSLVEKQGVKVAFTRQDAPDQMQNELVAFATELEKGNPQPSAGAHFVAIMGDGAAAFLQAINPRLQKLGDEYIAEVVGSAGYSRGEDQFMGLPEWKTNPNAARGAVIAGVLRDGDWNIAMRWAQINDIPNNPDTTTYDPNALNWVGTDSYIDASQKYITGYCEERPIKDKRSERKKVCVNAVVTWTPGDVMIAEQKGGLVTLLSTKTAIFQMPNTIIGIKKWNAANADKVAGMLAAFGQGADQVRTNADAFMKGAEVSAAVYKEQDAAYWAKYYRGVTKKDITGNQVDLGGSYVSNIADTMQLFGMSGGPNLFKATYETWGNVVIQQYPNVMKEYPPTDQILNTRYVQMASSRINVNEQAPAEKITYSPNKGISEVIGKRNYSITFALGSATILPASYPTLEGIVNDLVTSNTSVIIHGHTDNTGTPQGNIMLSESRANSVRRYLMEKGGTAIPGSRIRVVAHGQEEPLADNSTDVGRAKNRRVEVVIGR